METLIRELDAHVEEAEEKIAEEVKARDTAREEVERAEEAIAEQQEKLGRLRRGREELLAGASDPAPKRKASPRPAEDPPRRRRRSSSTKTSPPASSGPAAAGDRPKGEIRRDQVIAYIREHPGCTGTEISKGLVLDPSKVSALTNALARSSQIRREKDGRTKRHFPAEHPVTSEDDRGAKTEVERKILDACTTGATIAGVEEITGIREAGRIMGGLLRRGALVRTGPAGRNALYTAPKRVAADSGGSVEAAARAAAE